PADKLIEDSVELFTSLMQNGSLVGGETTLLGSMARSMIKAAVLVAGEYYPALDENGELAGYALWMPPGRVLFDTRGSSITRMSYVRRPEVEDVLTNKYFKEFPGFVNKCMGSPKSKTDAWWLHNLFVRPDRQRQGIGRQLIEVVKQKVGTYSAPEPSHLTSGQGQTLACSTTQDYNALVYKAYGFEQKGLRTMPSPWGDWPLYVFALDTAKAAGRECDNMADHAEESIALLYEGERSSQEDLKQAQPRLPTRSTPTLSQWISATLALFILADLLAYLYVFRAVVNDIRDSEAQLEFRSPYRGLDDLYGSGEANSSRHDPIENVPRVAAVVTNEDPEKVYPLDEHRRLSAYGTVTPLDRHLRVSGTMHTVLQFRVMDYGMERCALALRLPFIESNTSKPVDLDICALDVSRQLNPRTLSWSTRPPCKNLVGTLRGGAGEEVRLPEFSCKWGELYTYEVSCAAESPACDVDVWADRNGTWGEI
ncbi:uncharacterized protein C8Q71DRAFT_703475, partial [Rhodofomes roseus]